ncbi:MAG: SDR family NAD(P)-dependent oxidoreductase [Microbacterium sp.]
MDTSLAGKVVIVTGATSNIGRGVLLSFADEGARVVAVGRDAQAGERVLRQARERGAADTFWRPTDVTRHDDATALVADVIERFGAVDVLVNGVGGNADVEPFSSSRPEDWNADISLNLVSVLNVTHAVLPHMLERGSGRIINIGSTSALMGDRYMAVYSAAKGAVHSFTKVLALEVGKAGVTVNAVAPYRTRPTDPEEAAAAISAGSRYHPGGGVFSRLAAERPELLAGMLRETAVPRDRAHPDEIGAAAVYLASRQAEFVTGQVLVVDGGALIA